jgi:ATP-dependent RNA helicase UAP56/SUB2
VKSDLEALKVEVPHIVVGTPGRVMDLATSRKVLDLSHVKHFVLDECDRMLAEVYYTYTLLREWVFTTQ